jgi:hypothetical protein
MKRPMLAPNQILGIDLPWETLMFPVYCSTKANGVRGVLISGSFRSRNMKPLNINPSLQKLLEFPPAKEFVLDGEFYAPSLPTIGTHLSVLADNLPLPDDFFFRVFDVLSNNEWKYGSQRFEKRLAVKREFFSTYFHTRIKEMKHKLLHNMSEVEYEVERVKREQEEGLMFISPHKLYQHTRATVGFWKYKIYGDPIDGQILSLIQQKENMDETKYNPYTGYAERVNTEDSYIFVNRAAAMLIKTKEYGEVAVPFPVGTTFSQRSIYWAAFGDGGQNDLKGKWVSFRALSHNEKDKPTCIKEVTFRDEKEEDL